MLCVGAGSMNWQAGFAVRYAPGVMQKVALNRRIAPQSCMVAWTHARARDMGETWLDVEGIETGKRLRCLVVDLPHPKDRPNLIRRGIMVELDYRSSLQICPSGWGGAARECAVRVSK
jgi:hypothetical protein